MSATDELRRLLDERDVKYQKLNEYVTWVFLEDRAITFYSDGFGVSAEVSYPKPVLNGTKFLTPEQAIAATLGDDAYDAVANEHVITAEQLHALLDEWDKHPGRAATDGEMMTYATLGGGKLTAEQVREAIMSADRWEKPMGNTGLTNTHLIIRDDGWQAIADELNATLGGDECEMVTSGTPCDGNADKACTSCGAYNIGEYYDGQGHIAAPKFCPECGRRVKAVKR